MVKITILYPSIAQRMDTLGLVLANDDIPDSRTRQKVEDSVGISALGLLVAAALRTLVTLHLSIEDLARLDIHGLIEHHSLLGDWEFQHREGKSW